MKRNISDIQDSWKRVRSKDLASLKLLWKNPPKQMLTSPEDRLKLWELQKSKIKHLLEIEYDSLKEHPLWIDKEKRDSFLWHQTREKQFDSEKMVKKL